MPKEEREIPSTDKIKEHYFADCHTFTANGKNGTVNVKFGVIVNRNIPNKARADIFLSVSLPYAEVVRLYHNISLVLSHPTSNVQHYIQKEDEDLDEQQNRI